MKKIFKDLASDACGLIGIKLSIMPLLVGLTSFIQLLAAIGGLVLLYYSIKYKIELLKEKQIQNEQKQKEEEIENEKTV